jgi:mono/diheme cytochrome c family protein
MPDMPPSGMSLAAPHEPEPCPAPQLDSDEPVVPDVDVVAVVPVVASECVAEPPPHALTPSAAAAANQIERRSSIIHSPLRAGARTLGLRSYAHRVNARRLDVTAAVTPQRFRWPHARHRSTRPRMPHHVSLALGVAFVVLALAAVLLQAWLWNPKYWDPIEKKSHAPPAWMRVHRVVGYAYGAVYVVMMANMVPRLWGYAVELPARTVVHVVAAVVIGVLLLTKIAILRWFRHFEEAMPALGLGLLVSTVVLASMSIPLGFRAYSGLDLTDDERARLERLLETLDFGARTDTHALADAAALAEGRDVVTRRCTQCHDLRSILSEPRTAPMWLSLVRRMADKPGITRPLTDHEVMHVTAYLVAITPDLQRDAASRYAAERAATMLEPEHATSEEARDAGVTSDASALQDAALVFDAGAIADSGPPRHHARPRPRRDAGTSASLTQPAADAGAEPTAPRTGSEPATTPAPPAPPLSGAALLTARCLDCHGEDELEAHGPDDRAGWSAVLRRMVGRGADLSAAELATLASYLATTRGS